MLLLGLLFAGGAILITYGITSEAIALREDLEASYPDQFKFTPRTDSTIPADRVERFLTVRARLMPFCEELTDLGRRMEEMDSRVTELDASEEVRAGDLFDLMRRVGGISRGMVGVGNRLGEYSLARNEALLEQEMGLGEYTWIYVIAYFSWLEHEPAKFVISDEDYPRIFRNRILGNVRGMVQRQVERMEHESVESETLAAWRAELEALESDPLRVPFAEGLPESLEASLSPARDELEEVYCAATSELDFMRTEGGGLAHDHL